MSQVRSVDFGRIDWMGLQQQQTVSRQEVVLVERQLCYGYGGRSARHVSQSGRSHYPARLY